MWFTELKIKIHFLYQLKFKTFCNYGQIQTNWENGSVLSQDKYYDDKDLILKKLVILL